MATIRVIDGKDSTYIDAFCFKQICRYGGCRCGKKEPERKVLISTKGRVYKKTLFDDERMDGKGCTKASRKRKKGKRYGAILST